MRLPLSLLLLPMLGGCDKPTGFPPQASAPNSKDTADFGERAELPVAAPTEKGEIPQLAAVCEKAEYRSDEKAKVVVRTTALGYRIQWLLNGAPLSGETRDTLSPEFYEKGDVISATVTARLGEAEVTVNAPGARIVNAPPQIVTKPRDLSKLDGFQMRAVDPDRDALTWSLEDAPPALTITPSGRLSFAGSEDAVGGSYDTQIIVTDEDGESQIWPLKLNVSAGRKASKVKVED